MNPSLPIWQIHSQIVATLRSGNRLVLVAPTGSGKTTQVPQMLLEAGLADSTGGMTPAEPTPDPSQGGNCPSAPERVLPSSGGIGGGFNAQTGGQKLTAGLSVTNQKDRDARQRMQIANKIVVLQQLRVAARTVAARVAWERGCRLGEEVGYQIRFDDQTSLGTRICFVTEGILLRWLQDNRTLSDVGIVLFDEFHERNLLSDVALALVKQLQQTHRPDLKMAVMSATLEAEPVAEYLGDCPVFISEGRSFPVQVQYQTYGDERPITEQAAHAVETIVSSGEA